MGFASTPWPLRHRRLAIHPSRPDRRPRRPPTPAAAAAAAVPGATAVRRRGATAVAAVQADVPGQLIERWYTKWRAGLGVRAAELRAAELTALTDENLGRHLDAAIALADDVPDPLPAARGADGDPRGARRHLPGAARVGRRPDLRPPERDVDRVDRAGSALTALVALVQRVPAFEYRAGTAEDVETVLADDPEVATAFADYLSRHQ